MRGEEIALYVAIRKAETFQSEIKDNEIVITADTIVWCDNRILDKPVDKEDAVRIIREISGKTHEVITGVCLLSAVKTHLFLFIDKSDLFGTFG